VSREDLIIDLRTEAASRPAAPAVEPPPPAGPAGTPTMTPAFDLAVTPLRWSLPSVGPAPRGVGVAVRVGPVQWTVGLR
jgi:hypothetical protein